MYFQARLPPCGTEAFFCELIQRRSGIDSTSHCCSWFFWPVASKAIDSRKNVEPEWHPYLELSSPAFVMPVQPLLDCQQFYWLHPQPSTLSNGSALRIWYILESAPCVQKRRLLTQKPKLPRRCLNCFGRDSLFTILNPKTALFFYAFLSQFVYPDRGSTVVQILILGGLFVLLVTITDGTNALLGAGAGWLLSGRTPFQKIRKYVNGESPPRLGQPPLQLMPSVHPRSRGCRSLSFLRR
jgi:hypothetical protein